MIPREHGAWMMLYAPLVVGLADGQGPLLPAWLDVVGLVLLVTGAFGLRVPVGVLLSRRESERGLARRWAIRYSELMLAGAVLVARNPNRIAILIVVCVAAALMASHFALSRRREHRTIFGELIGVAGLTVTSALGYFVAFGGDWMRAGVLWAVCFLFFGSSVFYVKWRVARRVMDRRAEPPRGEALSLASYHVFVIAALAGLVLAQAVSPICAVAFLPLGARYALPLLTGPRPSLVQIGVSEIVLSLAFVGASLLTL